MNSLNDKPVLTLVSNPDEVDELAEGLADEYIRYFDVDIGQEQCRYQDSIEECLAHLEEVISVLEGYEQFNETLDQFVDIVSSKRDQLNRLFDQVDDIEQYLFETNRTLDKYEATLVEFESRRGSKIKQIINMILK